MQKWTQDESIAFECAQDAITDMMAIQSHEIAIEESKTTPDTGRIASLHAELFRLQKERRTFSFHSHAEIARIRTEYGAISRAWTAKYRETAA